MKMSMKPFRLALAQRICRPLPPPIAQVVRTSLYPRERAFQDDYEFEVRAATGSRFRHRTSEFHGYRFSVHGYFDWRNWAVALAVCAKGDTIIEIGANIGTETIGFSDIVGRTGHVHAFEPFPENLKAIQSNIALNNLDNVTLYPLAIGAQNGQVSFVVPPDRHASGVGYITRSDSADGAIKVECVTLDSLGDRLGKARAIFMDVEGAEIEVLQGARNYIAEVQPVIVLEASPVCLERAGHDLGALHKQLTEQNYKPFRISRFGVADIDLHTRRAGNWLCVPASQTEMAESADRMIKRCGLMPCVLGLNPLVRKS